MSPHRIGLNYINLTFALVKEKEMFDSKASKAKRPDINSLIRLIAPKLVPPEN